MVAKAAVCLLLLSFCSGLSLHDTVGIPHVGVKAKPPVSKSPPFTNPSC